MQPATPCQRQQRRQRPHGGPPATPWPRQGPGQPLHHPKASWQGSEEPSKKARTTTRTNPDAATSLRQERRSTSSMSTSDGPHGARERRKPSRRTLRPSRRPKRPVNAGNGWSGKPAKFRIEIRTKSTREIGHSYRIWFWRRYSNTCLIRWGTLESCLLWIWCFAFEGQAGRGLSLRPVVQGHFYQVCLVRSSNSWLLVDYIQV